MVVIMKTKIILLIFLLCLISPVLASTQTVSFTQDTLWTCPSDVNSIISLKMIGGGAGGMGGYYWQVSPPSAGYGWGTGAGGANGTYIEASNVPVTPGQTYSIVIGAPGVGSAGMFLYNTSTTHYTYGNSGQNSSAFGYTALGGVKSSESWVNAGGSGTLISVTLSHNPIGDNGYGNYQIASSGASGTAGYTNIFTSYGSYGGLGYGAGGGGGGAGSPSMTYGPILGGSGGNGAYGYVEITYDSASTQVLPTGYVIDAYTSAAISGASVVATQNGIAQSTSSALDGSFTISSTSLTVGIPITITTTKSGYGNDINTFTALASGPVNLTIPLIASTYYTSTSIVGITRDNLYGNPVPSAIYSAQDTSTLVVSTATSNINGFASVTGLDSAHLYFIWANKTGYTSASPVLAKTYS
jgi:hypothetical protein